MASAEDLAFTMDLGPHKDADLLWLAGGTAGDGGGGSDFFDQFAVLDGIAAGDTTGSSSAAEADEDALFALFTTNGFSPTASPPGSAPADDEPLLLAASEGDCALIAAPRQQQDQLSPARPRELHQQRSQSVTRAADPPGPGRGCSFSDAELLGLEGLSMQSPRAGRGVSSFHPQQHQQPASSAYASSSPPHAKKPGRLEALYSSIRKATAVRRHGHRSGSPALLQPPPPQQGQPAVVAPLHTVRSLAGQVSPGDLESLHLKQDAADVPMTAVGWHADPRQVFPGSPPLYADAAFATGFVDDPFAAVPPTPVKTEPVVHGLPACPDPRLSSASWPASAPAGPPPAPWPTATADGWWELPPAPAPPALELAAAHAQNGLYDGGLMIHMPRPRRAPSALLAADPALLQLHPPPPARRHRPRAPSSGARHHQRGAAGQTSPRKRSGGSSDAPSPQLPPPDSGRSARRSASLQSLRPAAAPVVRKRRSAAAGLGAAPPPTSPAAGGGFVNFTPQDGGALLAGVAPSGSAKTKARREREAAERHRRFSERCVRAVAAAGADPGVVRRLKQEGFVLQ